MPRNYSEPPLCSDNEQNKVTWKCQWCWCETLTSWYASYNSVHLINMIPPVQLIINLQSKKFCIFSLFYILFLMVSIYTLLQIIILKNFIICVSHRLRANLLAVHHLLTWNRTQQNISTRIYATTVSSMNVTKKLKLNSVALVRERTIPTERPPPVGEISANFCG